ncbi:MAG TPA: MATE family efflux transporter [Candidatus Ornithomonoglobus intestinigallinarum]|uniref:MATE family efflux transporter n=1 Tax=Candidatus Ornithomonoglobus intestinigallinarum TaxID=2840894 RepID=A0A9D1KQ51_9FIRM|nr:MATE family efflux transporter [Candidatus Ornithomonoglobus intestinigallinarum]
MDSHKFFTQTRPGRLFVTAALPGAIGMFASALYQLADGIFVGRIIGGTAFAALNLAMPFVIINFALSDLIGVGSSVPISISLGQRRDKEANNIFTCSCIMIVIIGIIIGALLYACAPALMRFMGADGEFAALAVQYLRVYAICSPLTTIVFAVDNYLRICGRIKFSMVLNIIMSVLSAGLEFVFLFVFRWGIWGAALGTCLGMMICTVIAFVPFIGGRMRLRFYRPKFRADMIKRIAACGMPTFLNNIAGRVTSIVMNMLLVRWGGESAVSVYGILMYVDGIVQSLLYGMVDSLQPAIGYNWGAALYKRVRAIGKYCFLAGAVFSWLVVAVIFMFPELITELFMGGGSGGFMEEAVLALRLFGTGYIIRWFATSTQSFLLAVEKPIPATLISISVALVFPLLFILVLWNLHLTGLWLNFAGTSFLSAALAAFMLFKYRKELLRE